ncbi:hypothetical protein P170DRAFT_477459 [Aspergillus steynii IBT 23096]|uniref:Methyltransferase n=1 Tax=Aspergillus steynii IBT 23096 TaxID=1392250 RepID=A0A2I2G119_9EURO|nr:uncharacterized protein P170DRAFT_477459 [Aspergillus steynii IBT 23096]PLB46579.1 hypothetical protein P170DRAFT_477459 [Aspergillus steynii IBT 23096]
MSSTTNTTSPIASDATGLVPRGCVQVRLNFYEPPADGSQPFQYAGEPPEGTPALNYGQPALSISLYDIRGHESEFTLEKDAFQALEGVLSPTPYETFLSDETVKRDFYPQVEKLLLDHVSGAHRVIIFDHVIRMERKDSEHSKPLHTAHADQTARAAANRVRLCVPDAAEAEELLRRRYRIINVWKPLKGPVQSCPLAFASGSSVSCDELVPIEFRLPHRTGEIVGVAFNPDQKWMYWSGMQVDECLLLKCNDSNEDVAMQVPHSAFEDPRTPAGAPGRESIEVRALVFG